MDNIDQLLQDAVCKEVKRSYHTPTSSTMCCILRTTGEHVPISAIQQLTKSFYSCARYLIPFLNEYYNLDVSVAWSKNGMISCVIWDDKGKLRSSSIEKHPAIAVCKAADAAIKVLSYGDTKQHPDIP